MKLFVGFDIRNNNIVLLSAERASDAAHTEYLHFSSRIFTDEFFAEAEKLLEEYFAHKPSLRNRAAYVVLPNEAVSFETFNLPNMSRAKTDLAFDAELNNLYEGRQKSRKINRFVLAQNKQFTTFGAVFFDKKLVAAIYKLLTDVRLFPKETTYRGSALLNCAYNFAPRLRGKSFVFADMHLDYTEIAVSGKGRLLGAATIPHGTSILKTDKVVSEYMGHRPRGRGTRRHQCPRGRPRQGADAVARRPFRHTGGRDHRGLRRRRRTGRGVLGGGADRPGGCGRFGARRRRNGRRGRSGRRADDAGRRGRE